MKVKVVAGLKIFAMTTEAQELTPEVAVVMRNRAVGVGVTAIVAGGGKAYRVAGRGRGAEIYPVSRNWNIK